MKFNVQQSLFLKNIQSVASIVPLKHTIFLLSHILIEADKSLGKVTLKGTDLEMSIVDHFECDVEEGGSVTVPGKRLMEIMRELPDAEVFVETTGTDLKIKCGGAKFLLKGQSEEDYPKIPQVKKENIISLPQESFRDMIRKVVYASPTDDSRQCLNGGYLHLEEKNLVLVATDGHRLALMKEAIATDMKDKDSGVIIPVNTLSELLRIIRNEGDIIIAYHGNQISFEMGNTVLTSRLIEDKYPQYKQVIPDEFEKKSVVGRDNLLNAIRRVSTVVSERTSAVKFQFSNQCLSLFAESPDLGQAQDQIEAEYEGESLQIAINAQYVLDAAKNIDEEEVEIHFSNKLSPVVIQPKGNTDYVCLIMPLRQ